MNEPHLPCARPVLDRFLALDRRADVIVGLVVHQHLEPVSFREPLDQPFAMLIRPLRKIAGDAGVERAVAPIGHDVDPAAHVADQSTTWMTGTSPMHDGPDRFVPSCPALGRASTSFMSRPRRGWPAQGRP